MTPESHEVASYVKASGRRGRIGGQLTENGEEKLRRNLKAKRHI